MRAAAQKHRLLLLVITMSTLFLRPIVSWTAQQRLVSLTRTSSSRPSSSARRRQASSLLLAASGAYNLSTAHPTSCTPTIFPDEALQYDHYNGVTIHLDQLPPESSDDFANLLRTSLQTWRQQGRRGIWMHIDKSQSDKVHEAILQGFDFHFVTDRRTLVLTCWLDESSPSRLPLGPTHQVGVGCLVLHPEDRSKMLVVQEKTGPAAQFQLWKMPTGLCDPGEDIHLAAERELQEETGLKADFVGVLTFRQAHSTRGQVSRANSDLFFVCSMQLQDGQDLVNFTACPDEIAAIQWMSVTEYCAQERWHGSPVYMEMNDAILNASKQHLFRSHTLPLGFGRGTNTLYKSSPNAGL